MQNNVNPDKNVPILVDEILNRFNQLQAEEARQNVPCFFNTEGERSFLIFQVPVKIDVSRRLMIVYITFSTHHSFF